MKAEKRKPLPVDTEDANREAERRNDLAGNDAYRRGIVQAQAQERSNAQHALDQGLADLKRVSLNRDTTVAARDSYNRCHSRVIKAAERLASIMDGAIGDDGKVIEGAVSIPAWLPPPTPTKEQTVTVRAPRVDGSYRESKGLSPGGKGLPLPAVFGSAADDDWMETSGRSKS